MDEADGLLGRSVLYGDPQEFMADYGPLDALLISAGAATNAAKNQALLKAFAAAGLFNDFVGNPGGREWADIERARVQQELEEQARLYEQFRQAFPYMSAVGESLPAATTGLRGMGNQMQFNLGRTMLEQAADGSENPLARKLTRSLRSF